MNAEEFVDGIYSAAYRSATNGVLRALASPPGRRPRPHLVELSAWFNGLSSEDREQVGSTVRLAADQAIFDILAVLDGVSVLDEGHTEFYLRTGDGTLLNEDHDLHELFQISVDHELGYVDEQGKPLD
jgi:hypothetical protein